jgi:PadR family transcriptional regulator PadR
MKDTLGQLELLLLLAVMRRGNRAFGLMIQEEVKEEIGRELMLGTIYNTMERLEKKGYVSSSLGDESSDRLGRPRRYFSVESSGRAAVNIAKRELDAMWVPGALGSVNG